jgi:hypothetical protein
MWSGTLTTKAVAVATEAIAETVEIVGVDPVVAVAEILTIVAAKIVGARVVLAVGKANAVMAAVVVGVRPVVADLTARVLVDLVGPVLLVAKEIVLLVIVDRVLREIVRLEIVLPETVRREIARRVGMVHLVVIVAPGMIVGTVATVVRVGKVDREEIGVTVVMTDRGKSVHGWIMVGAPASSLNRVRWKPWRSRSRRPAVLTPYLMSRNYSFPPGIGIWCTSFIKTRPHPPGTPKRQMRRRKPPRPSPLRHRNSCNAPWTARCG